MENPSGEKIQQTIIKPILEDDIRQKEKEKFFPSGAIVFFILLVLLCLAFWYGIYFLMIHRA